MDSETKECRKCREVKLLSDFYSYDKTRCKECRRKYERVYRFQHREVILRRQRDYWDTRYRGRYTEKQTAWKSRNRERTKACRKARRATNPNVVIRSRLRSRLNHYLNGTSKSVTREMRRLLGCSVNDFRIYIESQFEPGMSWSNYGLKGWHIDHILPCALFDLTRAAHRKICFHFSNMQPLWAGDNLRKFTKVHNSLVKEIQ